MFKRPWVLTWDTGTCTLMLMHTIHDTFSFVHQTNIVSDYRLWYLQSARHYIPARSGARRVMARGAFPRAEVTRATDWDYGDDDGKLSVHAQTKCL